MFLSVPEYGFNEFIPHSPEIMGVYIRKDSTTRQHDPRDDHRENVMLGGDFGPGDRPKTTKLRVAQVGW